MFSLTHWLSPQSVLGTVDLGHCGTQTGVSALCSFSWLGELLPELETSLAILSSHSWLPWGHWSGL